MGVHAFRLKNNLVLIDMISIILLGMVCVAGSNNGMIKFPGFLLAPFVMAFFIKNYKSYNVNIKYVSSIIVIPIAIYGIVYFIPRKAFLDDGIKNTTSRIESGRAMGIFTTKERVRIVCEIEQIRKDIGNDSEIYVIGEGTDRFAYEYLLNDTECFSPHEWMKNMPLLDYDNYIDWVNSKATYNSNVVFVYLKRSNGSSKMKEFFDNNMYKIDEKSSMVVYKPTKNK